MLTRAQLKVYEQANKPVGDKPDARVGSTHDRHARSFVRVPYGRFTVYFYPLKNWPALVGVTNQTLRTWIQRKVITAYTMHRMYVMCRAELEALRKQVLKHRMSTMKHTEITEQMRLDCQTALMQVRIALDTLKNPALTLAEEQRALLQPSLGERH